MPIVQPPKQRHSMQEEGSSLKFIIPSAKQYLLILFLGFWLTLWAMAEVFVIGTIFGSVIQLLLKNPGALLEVSAAGLTGMLGGGGFLLVWLAGWTLGGGFALYTFLWQLAGKENIEVSHDAIKTQNAVFGLGRSKEYSATYIKDLRVSPTTMSINAFGWPRSRVWGRPSGLIAFDYGAKTFRFGGGIDEAEAKQILEKILTRFPQYRGQ